MLQRLVARSNHSHLPPRQRRQRQVDLSPPRSRAPTGPWPWWKTRILAFASIGEQITFVLLASVGLYIVISAIATLIINNLLRPLSRLNESVAQLAEGQGDLTQRIDIERMDEIGVLGR